MCTVGEAINKKCAKVGTLSQPSATPCPPNKLGTTTVFQGPNKLVGTHFNPLPNKLVGTSYPSVPTLLLGQSPNFGLTFFDGFLRGVVLVDSGVKLPDNIDKLY